MTTMPYRKKVTTTSVRWKWGLRLTIAFITLFLFTSLFVLNKIHEELYERERQYAGELVTSVSETLSQFETTLTENNVTSLMEKVSASTTTKGVLKIDNVPFLDELENRGITIRVFSPEGSLLYESRRTNTNYQRVSGFYLNQTKLNNRDAFIGGDTIVTKQDSKLLGYVQIMFRLTQYHNLVAKNNKDVFLFMVVGMLICVLLGYGFAQYFFRPIKHMVDTMNDITEDTLSQSRIVVKSTNAEDELTDLSEKINDLLDKMALYVRQQKQFVEDVSHELRTPTAIVEGHLKLLNRWGKDDPQVLDESLSASLNEITRMKTLVQEMLDLSRAEQVQMHYKNEITPIREVVEQVFHNFDMLYEDFSFFFDDDLDEERYINIYRNHLEQILVILLDNAVKYSTNRKEIHISVSETLSRVQIAIQDFGEGMSQEDQQRIFNRFYRVDKARSREKGGHGLGLSIAKELLEGYKGDISVESVLGHGTVFRIQLPFIVDYKVENEVDDD
ncbi:MAG TPA: HAMP domain-containing histidine kinase [Candidatus Jeotgalibaca merdavium]|uniref:Signal transduction histidine-protein kinase ArlS n=1 Tax=Candidatus Jeotgalibaca merdavium TaxID=2838627 RepID=A0A9D2I0Y7_9LACT|nr:HAMP domain-containing histidine kinase [Candidatus Jeotgalibaca merdavium]